MYKKRRIMVRIGTLPFLHGSLYPGLLVATADVRANRQVIEQHDTGEDQDRQGSQDVFQGLHCSVPHVPTGVLGRSNGAAGIGSFGATATVTLTFGAT